MEDGTNLKFILYLSNEKSATLYTAKINKIYLLDLKKGSEN